MFPKQEIDGFEKYWRRRKPGSSTAVHYASDVRIFFKWIDGRKPDSITVHDVDGFIEWQQSLGRAPATIRRRLIALRMFFDYLSYICEQQIANPVVAQRHYVDKGHRLPRDIRQEDLEKLFVAIGDHQRDRTIFTLMLHTGLRVGEFLQSPEAGPLFLGNWGILGMFLVMITFNILGEEFLWRGVLLPRMNGVFGKWDWIANGVLGTLYHVSMPWSWLGTTGVNWIFFYALPAKYFRSTWFSIITHGSIMVLETILILGLVLGLMSF